MFQAQEACSREARAKTEPARKAKRGIQANQKQPRTSSAAVQLACFVSPGVASILGTKAQSASRAPMHSLFRLAMSHKVRGSSADAKRVAAAQQMGMALVARTALSRQVVGLFQWLENSSAVAGSIRAFCGMWDEASQKTRAKLLDRYLAQGQNVVEVFVLLGSVFQVVNIDGADQWRWEPWLAAPMILSSARHEQVLNALDNALPFSFGDPESLLSFGQNAQSAIISLCFDAASSNMASYRHMVHVIESLASSQSNIILHGERCLTHAIHAVKSDGLLSEGISGALYSLSRIMTYRRAKVGLLVAMRDYIKSRLVVRTGVAPLASSQRLFEVLKSVLYSDGRGHEDQSECTRSTELFGRRKGKQWLADLQAVCEVCSYENGMYVVYIPDGTTRPSDEDLLQRILGRVTKILVSRSWGTAALNRWSGTISVLKRVVLGCMLNDILPSTVAGLGARMDITEAQVEERIHRMHAAELAGEAKGEGEQYAIAHSRRVLRLGCFFRLPSRSLQCGIVLTTCSLIDRMHWVIIGTEGRPKASLMDLLRPHSSPIIATLGGFVRLMSDWSSEMWPLLPWLGLPAPSRDKQLMGFARAVVVRLSAGVFLCSEMKFACYPYKLLRAACPELADPSIVAGLDRVRPCCLGPFGRAFRKLYGPQAQQVSDSDGMRALQMWNGVQRLSTSPVECEHKNVKNDVQSSGPGVSPVHVCNREVCRQLQAAHLKRGHPDISLVTTAAPRVLTDAMGGGPTMDFMPLRNMEEIQTDTTLAVTDVPASSRDGQSDVFSEAELQCLGGGNPKFCFINYKIQVYTKDHVTSKEEVNRLRRAAAVEFDASESIQKRWKIIFQWWQLAGRERRQRMERPLALAPSQGSHLYGKRRCRKRVRMSSVL